MSKIRERLMTLAFVAVIGAVAAGCAASEGRGDPSADGVAVVTGACSEEVLDCSDTLIDGDLPPAPAGSEDESPDSAGFIVDGGIDISEAIAYEGTEVVAVRGYFVADGQTARLCEVLAESYPPQCGGVHVVVTNPEALSHTVLIEEGDTQWSEDWVIVLGHVVGGELTIASNVSGSNDAVGDGFADEGVQAMQIDGVWVFQHEPDTAMAALHSGTPEIVNGCLVIDNTIVVWHTDTLEDAAAAIAAVKAGNSPQLLIGGGGLSVSEGADPAQIPAVISERCPTTAVWFGAP